MVQAPAEVLSEAYQVAMATSGLSLNVAKMSSLFSWTMFLEMSRAGTSVRQRATTTTAKTTATAQPVGQKSPVSGLVQRLEPRWGVEVIGKSCQGRCHPRWSWWSRWWTSWWWPRPWWWFKAEMLSTELEDQRLLQLLRPLVGCGGDRSREDPSTRSSLMTMMGGCCRLKAWIALGEGLWAGSRHLMVGDSGEKVSESEEVSGVSGDAGGDGSGTMRRLWGVGTSAVSRLKKKGLLVWLLSVGQLVPVAPYPEVGGLRPESKVGRDMTTAKVGQKESFWGTTKIWDIWRDQ